MKTALITACIMAASVIPGFTADSSFNNQDQQRPPFSGNDKNGSNGRSQNLEQKKSEILSHIDERISNSQAEKTCVRSAASHNDLRSCKDKYRPKPREERQERKPQN